LLEHKLDLSTPDLRFDEDGHRYFLCGKPIPSVSEIIRVAAITDYTTIDPNILQRARDYGTFVHEATHAADLNMYGMDPIIHEWVGLRNQVFGIIGKPSPQVFHEQMVLNKSARYAGRTDRIYQFDRHTFAIVDIKTGQFNEKECGLQLFGYAEALHDMLGYKPRIRTFIAGLPRDGQAKLHEIQWRDFYTYFFSCLNVLNFRRI